MKVGFYLLQTPKMSTNLVMTTWYKQGVIGDLQQPARKGLGRVARLLSSRNEDLFITSLRDGNHSDGSLHYDGLAFDMRYPQLTSIKQIKEKLGPKWDVVVESNHIHCEYDPKNV